MSSAKALLRELPSVDRLLAHPAIVARLGSLDRSYLARQCRAALDELRAAIGAGEAIAAADVEELAIVARVERRIDLDARPGLVRVVNATGTILHTNLGRALLSDAAIEAVRRVAGQPANVEFDLARGARGKREDPIEKLLVWLTGAEAATVVNNKIGRAHV